MMRGDAVENDLATLCLSIELQMKQTKRIDTVE